MTKSEFVGFAHSSGMGVNPAILVVDFMNEFTNHTTLLGSNLDNEIEATKELLDCARGKDVSVIFTTVAYDSDFKDGAHFIQKVPALKSLTIGSKGVEIDPRLERNVEKELLITKKFASAFFGTNLATILAFNKIDTAIIVGCSTSGCVRATAVDALQHGYKVVIPRECVGDRSENAHEANLYDIQMKYGDVVDLETVKQYLTNLRGDKIHV